MDLSVPISNKAANIEENTVAAKDETKASSIEESCEAVTSGCGPLDIKGETEPLSMRSPKVDHTVRPVPISRPNQAPISVLNAGESNEVNNPPCTEEHCVDVASPGPVRPSAGNESMQSPEDTQQENCNGLTKSQRKRVKLKQRKMLQNSRPPAEETVCSSRKRTLAVFADSSQTYTEVKRTRVETQAETSIERAAIIPVTFPAEQILQSHIAAIQEAMITRLLDATEPLPYVTLGNLVGGALFASCIGRDSVNWLSETLSLKKIAGLNIKVVDAKDLPKPVKMAWKTKIVGDKDFKLLLRVLQRFNPSLNTDQWKVIDTSLDSYSSRRIILMDRASADVIRNAGYQLHSGIDISSFKVLEDTERGKTADYSSKDVPNDPILLT